MHRGGGVLIQADVPEAATGSLRQSLTDCRAGCRTQPAAGIDVMDAALEAVGSPLGDELRTSSAGGPGALDSNLSTIPIATTE